MLIVGICCFLRKGDDIGRDCGIFVFWLFGDILFIKFGFGGLGNIFLGIVVGCIVDEELWVGIICGGLDWIFWCGGIVGFCIRMDEVWGLNCFLFFMLILCICDLFLIVGCRCFCWG